MSKTAKIVLFIIFVIQDILCIIFKQWGLLIIPAVATIGLPIYYKLYDK